MKTSGDSDAGRSRIAVVILNYRTPEMTLDCVRSVCADVDQLADRVVVVDNASGDGSADQIRQGLAAQGLERVLLVESPNNAGFAAGNNVGIRAVDAEAYLLLNSDTIVRQGAIEKLWLRLHSARDVGLSSPRLEWPDGEGQVSCFRRLTPVSELIQGSGGGIAGRLLPRWEVPLGLPDAPIEPDWTSFAAVLVRAQVFEQLGLLDEGFFMYFEDVDYCRMARRQGWRIAHEPSAHIVHLRGQTSPVKRLGAQKRRRPAYFYAARSRYFRRAYGPLGLLAANLGRTLGRALGLIRRVLAGKDDGWVERELRDVWSTW